MVDTLLIVFSCFKASFWFLVTDWKSPQFAEHPELYKDRSHQDDSSGSKQNDSSTDAAGAVQRQAATDEFMLERFRKRERHRVMRRWHERYIYGALYDSTSKIGGSWASVDWDATDLHRFLIQTVAEDHWATWALISVGSIPFKNNC